MPSASDVCFTCLLTLFTNSIVGVNSLDTARTAKGLHCLTKRLLKLSADDEKQTTLVVITALLVKMSFLSFSFMEGDHL